MPQWDSPVASLATFLPLSDIQNATTAFAPTSANGRDGQQLSHIPQEPVGTPVLRLIQEARNKGYESICLPLTTERWKNHWEGMCLLPSPTLGDESGDDSNADAEVETKKKEQSAAAELWRAQPGFLADEVTITRLDEAAGITVMVSDWLELDAEDDGIRHDAEIALQQELAYASYLNIHTAILPAPRNRSNVASYARIVNNCLKNTPYIYLSVRLPIYNPSILHQAQALTHVSVRSSRDIGLELGRRESVILDSHPAVTVSPDLSGPTSSSPERGISSESEMNATWEMWDVIRSICDYNTRLTLS